MESNISECPYCGENESYFIKQYATGRVTYRINYDGKEAENGDMYEALNYVNGKYAYCSGCEKRLFKLE